MTSYTPYKFICRYVEPGLRSELIKKLYRRGMTQERISRLFDISQPAVSKSLRGHGHGLETSIIEVFGPELKARMDRVAEDLAEGEIENGASALYELVEEVRKRGTLEDILELNSPVRPGEVARLEDFLRESG